MLPRVPGQMATVLVAFAVTDDSPNQINVGKLTSVPPPATELIMPARNAAVKASNAWKGLKMADTFLTRVARTG